MNAKRVITMVVCGAMVLSLAACGGNGSGKNEVKPNVSSEAAASVEEAVQIPNPWTECSDMKEAEENTGFSFVIPDAIEGYTITYIQNMDKELIEVIYEKTEDTKESEVEDSSIHLRKGTGTEDISGDCNTYSESNQVAIESYHVTMKGNNDSVSLATWTDGGFSYAVSVPEMSAESVTAIIQQMK